MKRVLPILVLVALCLVGAGVLFLLLQEHSRKTTGLNWFESVCGESENEGVSNCAKVIQSPWGMFLRRPTAYWGTAYFLGLTFWFLLVGRPSFERRYWHVVPTLAALAGSAVSVLLIVVTYTKLDSRCPWCLLTHVINFAVFVLTLLLWPRRPASPEADADIEVSALSEPAARRDPSTRQVFAVMLLAIITAGYLWRGVLMARVLPKVLYLSYQSSPRHEILRRLDDLQKTADDPQGHLETIVFSDFECSLCRQLSEVFEKEINPLFDDHLRIVFKHYPLCNECNPYVKTRSNPHVCKAARAAEAARMQGGDEAFWKIHDILFKSADLKSLGEMDYRELAESLNLDPGRFITTMESEEVARRIQEDVELAKSLGIRNTPAVFVGGKRVPQAAHLRVEFWKEMARHFKAVRAPSTSANPRVRDAHAIICASDTRSHGGS